MDINSNSDSFFLLSTTLFVFIESKLIVGISYLIISATLSC